MHLPNTGAPKLEFPFRGSSVYSLIFEVPFLIIDTGEIRPAHRFFSSPAATNSAVMPSCVAGALSAGTLSSSVEHSRQFVYAAATEAKLQGSAAIASPMLTSTDSDKPPPNLGAWQDCGSGKSRCASDGPVGPMPTGPMPGRLACAMLTEAPTTAAGAAPALFAPSSSSLLPLPAAPSMVCLAAPTLSGLAQMASLSVVGPQETAGLTRRLLAALCVRTLSEQPPNDPAGQAAAAAAAAAAPSGPGSSLPPSQSARGRQPPGAASVGCAALCYTVDRHGRVTVTGGSEERPRGAQWQ